MSRLSAACATSITLALASLSASFAVAAPITHSAASGDLAAAARFEVIGTDLVVTLTNTSNVDVLVQRNVLTAVFWDATGPLLNLNPAAGSAVLGVGSSVLFGGSDPGGVVGGEWAYAAGIGGQTPNGANYGISSAGFGIFGAANFPGNDLDSPAAVNGINYGITAAGDNPATGQMAVSGSNPLIKNQVVFTLPGVPAGFDPSTAISNVGWQYGTALAPTDPFIPEPGSALLLFVGALVAGGRMRSRRGL